MQQLVFDVFPHYAYDRSRKLLGLGPNTLKAADATYAHQVQRLATVPGLIVFSDAGDAQPLGRATAESMTKAADAPAIYSLAVADLGCGCAANSREICKHVEAAARQRPLTLRLMRAGAQYICRRWLGGKLNVPTTF